MKELIGDLEDLIELLQPHLENPGLERERQKEAILAGQEDQERKKEEEQKRLQEMIKEIEEVAVAMKKILQNSPCTITIAKKMIDDDGGKGKVNARLSVRDKEKGEIRVQFSGITLDPEDRNCLTTGLTTIMNQGEGFEDAFKKILYGPYCIKILYDFLSTDNVKVTYI